MRVARIKVASAQVDSAVHQSWIVPPAMARFYHSPSILLIRINSMKSNGLSFHHPVSFWLGCVAIVAGVLAHACADVHPRLPHGLSNGWHADGSGDAGRHGGHSDRTAAGCIRTDA